MGKHQRVISEHEAAMLHDIAEFDATEPGAETGRFPCVTG